MTNERKLAIQMWQGIRDMLIGSGVITSVAVVDYKRVFCKQHGLYWTNNCWFCKYIPACSKCPLGSCRIDSLYDIVKADYIEKDTRVAACTKIIKALGGEV